MLVRFVSRRGPFTCDERRTEVVIENGFGGSMVVALLCTKKQTNKKIHIRKKDHPLNWTLVSARNESRIMRLAKQTTTKSQDKNPVTFSSSSLCVWFIQNMLINTQTGTFCSPLCTVFGDFVLIRTGTLIATSRARKTQSLQRIFFFLFLTGTSSLMCHG